MQLNKADIVRHRLVQEIVRAYEEEPKRSGRGSEKSRVSRSMVRLGPMRHRSDPCPTLPIAASLRPRGCLGLPPSCLARGWAAAAPPRRADAAGAVRAGGARHVGGDRRLACRRSSYRTGDVPPRKIVARVDFQRERPKPTTRQAQDEARRTRRCRLRATTREPLEAAAAGADRTRSRSSCRPNRSTRCDKQALERVPAAAWHDCRPRSRTPVRGAARRFFTGGHGLATASTKRVERRPAAAREAAACSRSSSTRPGEPAGEIVRRSTGRRHADARATSMMSGSTRSRLNAARSGLEDEFQRTSMGDNPAARSWPTWRIRWLDNRKLPDTLTLDQRRLRDRSRPGRPPKSPT